MGAAVGQAQTVATPNEQVSVTLTKQEHVELVTQAHNWRSLHQRAVARIEQQRQQYSQALKRIKALERLVQEYERVRLREAELREQLIYSLEQAGLQEVRLREQHARDLERARQQEAELREELAQEQAYSRELRHRLFGQRSEKSRALNKARAPSQEHKDLSVNNVYCQRHFAEGDDGCCQMVERDEAALELLVAHEQLSKPIEPAMAGLDFPAIRPLFYSMLVAVAATVAA